MHRGDHGELVLQPHRVHQVEHALLVTDVERARGLVEQQHPRLLGQRPAEHDPLQLAAGEPERRSVGELDELEPVQRPLHGVPVGGGLGPEAPQVGRASERHQLPDRGPLGHHRPLRHQRDHPSDPAGAARAPGRGRRPAAPRVAGSRPGDGVQQRRLAGAVGADDRDPVARLDHQVDVGDDLHPAAVDRTPRHSRQGARRPEPVTRGAHSSPLCGAARSGRTARPPAPSRRRSAPRPAPARFGQRRRRAPGTPRRAAAPAAAACGARRRTAAGPRAGTTIPTNPISPLTLTTAAVPRVAVSTRTRRTRAGSTPRLAASTSPTAITSSTRRWSRMTRAGDHDVRERDHHVGPAVGAEPAEHPRVDREQRVVVPLLHEVLDRVEERADRDAGQDDHHGAPAAADAAAEGVRRRDAEQAADERQQRDAHRADRRRRRRSRASRPAPAPLETPSR